MTRSLWCLALLMCVSLVWGQTDDLERSFREPPPSARPHTWWHWVDGNVSREGITADLEAMQRVGIGGVQIFNVGVGIASGPVPFMSKQWQDLVQHAIREADRLGMEVCMHNCAGWSSSGGPWVKPEGAMQMVTTAEVRHTGPGKLPAPLPQPPTRRDFYKDIAVLAFPTPAAEAETMADLKPQVTCSVNGVDVSRVIDGRLDTAAGFPVGPGRPQTIDFVFPKPFTVRALWLQGMAGRSAVRLELSVAEKDDFRKLGESYIGEQSLLRPPTIVSFPATTGEHFRLTLSGARGAGLNVSELRLEPGVRVSGIGGKAGYDRGAPAEPATGDLPPETLIKSEQVLDLTDKLQADGRLNWDAPAGQWTIIRFGYTLTGKDNHPAPPEGTGLECDKMSAEAVDAFWQGMMEPVIKAAGPLAGKTFNQALIDSYEVDCQNWTPKMRADFSSRRGYDLLKLLPVLTGRVVDGLGNSERFLWDYRRTLADLYADNYFGRFAKLLHDRGMLLGTEPYGNGNFDELTAGGRADVVMSEFWVGQGRDVSNAKLASSVAHTNGLKYVGAESFTATDTAGKWQNHPGQLKPLGDLMYTGGVNRFIFHCYAQQPWKDLAPGMTMGPWGTHFSRTNTWWEQSAGWMKYLARCQYLLQSGRFVADVCYFAGEQSPGGAAGRAGLPAGYDYDSCDADTILKRMTVQGDRIVLPDGMSYRVLVLPPRTTMTPELLRKVADLVRAGATVIGAKPSSSPSLTGYPACDEQVKALADELWGASDGEAVTENRYGKGRIIWGKPLADVLADVLKLGPDVDFAGPNRDSFVYIHRQIGDAEAYFVSCQSTRPEIAQVSFRVTGKQPELWQAETGLTQPAPLYKAGPGRTAVTLRFEPGGSVWVVFRRPLAATNSLVSLQRDGQPAWEQRRTSTHKLEITRATYGVLSQELPDCVDVTDLLRRLVQKGALTVRASNDLAGDPVPNVIKQLRVDYTYNGADGRKIVDENQALALPDKPTDPPGTLAIRSALYGLLPPDGPKPETMTVDVTMQLAALVKEGTLSTVASNALAGDPANLIVKQLQVEYTVDGKPHTRIINENAPVELPDERDLPDEPSAPPVAELAAAANGGIALTAWDNGRYTATAANGKTVEARVTDVPAAQVVAGPWELTFPAAKPLPLDKLSSWTESDDPAVRYFSGTATYATTLSIPQALLKPGLTLMLDLGLVKEIARVSLNGQDLGVLWKPPFRVLPGKAAKAGANRLEVQVTNLWVNRLIGDERVDDDGGWTSGPIKAWPEWLLQGKPRPGPRRTFVVWKHWQKDAPLLDSGLLGPVVLRAGQTVPLKVPK